MLEADLQNVRQAKALQDSEVMKIYGRLGDALRMLDSEFDGKEDHSPEGNLGEQLASMTDNVVAAALEKNKSYSGMPALNDRVNDLVSHLEVACKAINAEKKSLESEKAIANLVNQYPDSQEQGLRKENEIVKTKLNDLTEQFNVVVSEKHDLENEVSKLSAQIQGLEKQRKLMRQIVNSGTKGRKQLRKIADDARRAKVQAETALKEREIKYSEHVKDLKSKVTDLEARLKANLEELRMYVKNQAIGGVATTQKVPNVRKNSI